MLLKLTYCCSHYCCLSVTLERAKDLHKRKTALAIEGLKWVYEEESRSEKEGAVRKGVASIALLPCGSLSGHFIQLPHSLCFGLHGTELACERECSRGEDYRLIKLTITDYTVRASKAERDVLVECRGHDAARFRNIEHAHGSMGKARFQFLFECKTLKADKAAEDHIRQFMPKLAGMDDAVVNVGRMSIAGLDFEAEVENERINQSM
ncbi:hypothetical protein Acr_27g0010060 [Actinidia rufa]|uniref:Uncharacterized protein n=1 Tax=Actinidia rufa TaxID=165716 RepID=A0A7J0H828_9ERIC|nr:hypothetical protein Acr_27g0010060 [Actinidia rufa]